MQMKYSKAKIGTTKTKDARKQTTDENLLLHKLTNNTLNWEVEIWVSG